MVEGGKDKLMNEQQLSDIEFKLAMLESEIASLRLKVANNDGGLLDQDHIPFKPRKVTIDLRGILYGPFNKSNGRYVVVNVASNVLSQSNVRPEVVPENEVWIDLKETYGRVYIPRLG